MADLTEKERLLEQMKYLSDVINQKKQKVNEHMGSSRNIKTTTQGNHRQQNLTQQQQTGSSGTHSLPRSQHPTTCASTTQVLGSTRDSSTTKAGQSSGNTALHKLHQASVQQQATQQSQNRNILITSTSNRDVNTSSSCAANLGEQRKVIHRRVIAPSSDPNILSQVGKGNTSTKQCCDSDKRGAVKDQTTVPTNHTLAEVVQCTTVSGVKTRKHAVSSQPGKASSSQLYREVTPKSTEPASGQKVSSNQLGPVQLACVLKSKNVNSSGKGKIVSKKNAEVIAAREIMQKKIADMKSKLADMEASKKRQNTISKLCNVKRDTCSDSAKPGLNCDKMLPDESYRTAVSGQMKDSGDQMIVKRTAEGVTSSTKENVVVCASPVKDGQRECSDNFLNDTQSVPSGRTVLAEQDQIIKKEAVFTEVYLNDPAKLVSEPAPALTEGLTKSPCSSALKSVAKANLARDLKATEEKLQGMRKKMGIMLKESPQSDRNGSGERKSHLQQAVLKANTAAHPYATPTSTSHSKQRLFPHRTNLKWTPRRKSTEHVVIGNSPNMRLPAVSSVKGSSSRQTLCVPGKSILDTSARGKTPTLRRRKSQYAIMKNNSSLSADKPADFVSKALVTQAQKPLNASTSSESFVSRYKIQRTSNGSKSSNSATSLARKTIVQSRYKLMKVACKGSPHSPAGISSVSPPLSAKQKAAQIIKTKYKMRKVPLPSLQSGNTAQTSQHQHVTPKNWAMTNTVSNLPGGRQNKFTYSTGYQFQNSLVPVQGRGSSRWRINNPYFHTGQLERGFHLSSFGGWDSNTKILPWSLQSKRQRARAVEAWKMQWKMQHQWGQAPYGQLVQSSQQDRVRQQMMRCMRQQWKNVYRKQASSENVSMQKKRSPYAKRERLVMINGTVYKSSSRRLTKAVLSGRKAKSGATSSASLNNSRGGKQPGMKTVVVRGIPFNVNARGTRLQRVTHSPGKGKMASFSGQDVSGIVQTGGAWGSQTRYVINRVKQRSIHLAAAKFRKKEGKETKKNCLYFSRFGKCSRGDACPFLHDPAKVAVCTRFLRGTCQVENCPFSHKVSKEKMPVCAFFLKGVCIRESCPYLHVKVSQGAEICQDFISAGFCALADKCLKQHTFICPHFSKTGACPDGKKCRLLHRRGRGARKRSRARSSSGSTHTPKDSLKGRKRPAQSEEGSSEQETHHKTQEGDGTAPPLPKRSRHFSGKLPAFIPLPDDSFEKSPEFRSRVTPKSQLSANEQKKGSSLQIKPKLSSLQIKPKL